LIHSWLGVLFIGESILPLVLNIPPNNMCFGTEGIFELTLMELAAITIGVMEHLFFAGALLREYRI
jgi:hypothetical protein